ncbi:MAG: hypothetical protein ACOX6U_09345 [Oscillospiraceae bacterium]|jgi:hypothetical protein
MNELTFGILFSILLLPVNLYCSFWIFKEVLNLAGMTFKEFISLPHAPFASGRTRLKRRQRFVFGLFEKKSSNPEKSRKLLRLYGISTLPGLAGLILAEYGAISQHADKATHLLIGNLMLILVNVGLAAAGRIYRRNHPLNEQTAAMLAAKRKKEAENGQKTRTKDFVVYSVVGVFFLVVLAGFHLGIASVFSGAPPANGSGQSAQFQTIRFNDVNTILRDNGFETANIPTSYWFYDESKLANVAAGTKGNTKIEFYEYTDGETTDGVYNSISYQLSPDLEFQQRAECETYLTGGGKMFTIAQHGISSLVLYQNNTVIYAHSPKSSNEIESILTQMGYLP